jgi:hypothetical protein
MLGGPSPLSQNLTREEGLMRKSALHYLGQRITSVANLKRVLTRRAQRKLGPQVDGTGMIERTIDYCRRNGFVDDAAFIEARIHSAGARGCPGVESARPLAPRGSIASSLPQPSMPKTRKKVKNAPPLFSHSANASAPGVARSGTMTCAGKLLCWRAPAIWSTLLAQF